MKRNGFLSVSIIFFTMFFGMALSSLAQEDDLGSDSLDTSASSEAPAPSTSSDSNRASGKSGTRMKERRTTLDFEDELVEGTNQKPDMIYLFQQKKFNYNRLIKLRENFKPEMRETVEDVQRIRSDN
jgi:hypothetical protein